MPVLKLIKKVLILGSGAIKIGEAGEFDYSGAQAVKALKEEGISVVLVNPNIATIQTDEKLADKVYFLPVTFDYVAKIIEDEHPDGILLGFGGQTALNCGVELSERGILNKWNVRVLGTGIKAIEVADNRDLFRDLMLKNGIPIPRSRKANSAEEALVVANKIGYPVMVRVAYTLGGQGSGVAYNDVELFEIVSKALTFSRIGQVLVEEYLDKWKEVEYEVIRDAADNCIIVCNMENFDPMGIHTGDSIVVAPSQTLTNKEYHKLRIVAFKVIRALGIVGECNIQFSLNPKSDEFKVIEVNSRLSRSSALASKATGYPIAFIAAKLGVGYTLPELINKVTGVTTACFEPALDYVVVKIPRWDFQKFRKVDRRIGTQMKSVGEVMAVGRTFKEAIQKAVRMLNLGRELLDIEDMESSTETITQLLKHPTDKRLFQIIKALERGEQINKIQATTGIDLWFLNELGELVDFKEVLKGMPFTRELLLEAKRLGFSDNNIGELVKKSEDEVRTIRKTLGIYPVVKQIDTLAAEWPAATNYLYMTYNGDEDDIEFEDGKGIIVLGSGCYRIGSSVEFDWCCVNMAWALKDKGVEEVLMVNCNPETVSTDFDVMDKLYFEELSYERVLDIIEKEKPIGTVVSVGGQTPNNLALRLARNGVKLLGTKASNIDIAEDREKFSRLLDELDIEQPSWVRAENLEKARDFAENVGYPILVRPSYVLSGSGMNIVWNEEQLGGYLEGATNTSGRYAVVVSKFFTDAKEVDIDAVSDGRNIFIGAIIEHLENAGVHSGDATMVVPSLTLEESVKEELRRNTRRIARSLAIKGPFNIQYLVKNGEIYVIECNMRASRSMPYVSKSIGCNLMMLSADALLGKGVPDGEGFLEKYCVKVPQFSFMRLDGADPVTGVEMVSTGEVASFSNEFEDAFLKSLRASGVRVPGKGDTIMISIGGEKTKGIKISKKIADKGYKIFATNGTAVALRKNGVDCDTIYKISEGKSPNVLDFIENGRLKLIVNTPSPGRIEQLAVTDGYLIRRKAVESCIPIITNLQLADRLTDVL
jgi:carbamoyl-phosphate synthase large subunit